MKKKITLNNAERLLSVDQCLQEVKINGRNFITAKRAC